MPVVEIATWIVSDAYVADPSIIERGFEFLRAVDGCRSIYWGTAHENTKKIFLFIEWETYEHHKAIMDRPGYPGFIGFLPSIGGEASMKHVEFPAGESYESYIRAVSAPVTEILSLGVKRDEGKTADELENAVVPLAEKVEEVNDKYASVARGVEVEDEGRYVALVGWESVKVHFETVRKHESLLSLIKAVHDIATPQMVHASLKRVHSIAHPSL